MTPIPLRSLLGPAVNRRGIRREVDAAQVCTLYAKILSAMRPDLAEASVALKYQRSILSVAAFTAPVAAELGLIKHELQEKLNHELPSGQQIKHIQIRIGEPEQATEQDEQDQDKEE